jgi:hypothetical protein
MSTPSLEALAIAPALPRRRWLRRRSLPGPRSRAYVRYRADELQLENQGLDLPSRGGFIRGLVELEAEAERRSLLFGKRTNFYNSLYYLLGLPSAILAAVAGATALSSEAGRIPAGIIALVASGLGAAVAFLDSAKQRDKSAATQAYWDDLYNEIHVARLTKLTTYTEDSGRWDLSDFYRRASLIRAGHDPGNDSQTSAGNAGSGFGGESPKLLFPPGSYGNNS